MKLKISHPFAQDLLKAEELEMEAGQITEEVIKIRKKMKAEYPEIFAKYIKSKTKGAKYISKKSTSTAIACHLCHGAGKVGMAMGAYVSEAEWAASMTMCMRCLGTGGEPKVKKNISDNLLDE